jgi:uncharacterized membrane protein
MKISLALIIILLFIAVSIGTNQESNVSSEDNEYLLHAESSERLINIMQQISLLANAKNLEETIKPTEEDMVDLIEAVEELLFYAELMSIKVPATELEESKGVIFSAMASQLYDEALNIQQLTTNYDFHVTDSSQEHILDEAYERLSQTCIACHQLFRNN